MTSERVVEAIERELLAAGLSDKPDEYDSNIHSWRCEYPERYGPCDCLGELVRDLAEALAPLLAEVRAEALSAARPSEGVFENGSGK